MFKINRLEKWRNHYPLLSSIFFIVMVVVLSFWKFKDWSGVELVLGCAFIGLYFFWNFAESKVSIAEVGKGNTTNDKGTCELYATARGMTVYAALLMPNLYDTPLWVLLMALLIFLAGVLFRLSAINTLGQFYSHRVRVDDAHEIIDSGPYRWIRHPAYTGMLIAHIGVCVFFFNWLVLCALVFFLLPAIMLRIRVEETALMTLPSYKSFAAHRQRLIPGVW